MLAQSARQDRSFKPLTAEIGSGWDAIYDLKPSASFGNLNTGFLSASQFSAANNQFSVNSNGFATAQGLALNGNLNAQFISGTGLNVTGNTNLVNTNTQIQQFEKLSQEIISPKFSEKEILAEVKTIRKRMYAA